MAGSPLPTSFIGLLAAHLAKLHEQLRHLSADDRRDSGWADPARVWVTLNRLRSAAAALERPARGVAAAMPALPELGRSLRLLSEGLIGDGAGGVRVPGHLHGPLEHLADHLERFFDDLDAGADPLRLAADSRWESLLAGFINAGTVLQALDDVEDSLADWSREYGDRDLSPSQDDALRVRWSLLRDYGDSLFGAQGDQGGRLPDRDETPADQALAGRRVVLLLDSPFLRAQVAERLHAVGCRVAAVDRPDQMLAHVGGPRPPDLLLCDNLEPSRHLSAVRARLGQLATADRPALVLVATAADTAERLRERARHLGAQGVWADPWRPADLVELLD